jgi:aerobic carbon-monoxide dehydrogenase medium subunit
MIPPPFEYYRAGSADEALSLAASLGEEAKFLAGGHSLLPLMKLRLAAPEALIDLTWVRELSYIDDKGDHVAIGALTRHHDVCTSDLLAREVPLLAHAASQVGDPQIRHRGTIGGSVAHADPASDLPAVLLALDATFVARGADGTPGGKGGTPGGKGGTREIAAGEFFQSLFETALEPGELLTEIRVPKPGAGHWGFQKFTQRAIDWAIVGVAVQGHNVALVNMGSTPLRATAVERALAAGAGPDEASALAAEGTSAPSDIRASTEYREHLARVLTRRALR